MKKFIVDFSYEMTGSIEVEAESVEEAKDNLLDDLEYYGLDGLYKNNKNPIDYSHREWDVL